MTVNIASHVDQKTHRDFEKEVKNQKSDMRIEASLNFYLDIIEYQ